jgi:hypothetical protein
MEKTMTRMTSFRLVLLVLAVSVAPAPTAHAAEVPAAVQPRPNILFFLTDDQPQIGLGCMGNPTSARRTWMLWRPRECCSPTRL